MNNPAILAGPMGPQFYTAPNGTIVFLNDGTPVDLSGVRLTASPNRFGKGASIALSDATVPTLAPGQILVTGLRNVTPDLVGVAFLLIANAANVRNQQPGPKFGDISNNGIFLIAARGTGYWTEDESVIINNPSFADPEWTAGTYPGGIAPDNSNGLIEWAIYYAQDYAPLFSEGQPLAEVARRGLELRLNEYQPAPMTFADYDPTLPPSVTNDQAGLFSKIQRM